MHEKVAESFTDSGLPETEFSRTQIGISIANPTHRRLVEGVSAQLGLLPIFLEEADLAHPERIAEVELLIADEERALRFQQAAGIPEDPREGIRLAVVAAVAVSDETIPILPNRNRERPFDGLLALPQQPAMVLAQLSVILYAHRAYIYRFESALEELHLNRRIFRSVTSGIVVASATQPENPVTYANPAFEVTTGYSLEEVLGQSYRLLHGEDEDQPGLTLLREALREKRETVVIVRSCRKHGSEFWNELSLSPIRNAAGEVTHFVSIQNDVTSRIDLEEALREVRSSPPLVGSPLQSRMRSIIPSRRSQTWCISRAESATTQRLNNSWAWPRKNLGLWPTSRLNRSGSIDSRPKQRLYVLSI